MDGPTRSARWMVAGQNVGGKDHACGAQLGKNGGEEARRERGSTFFPGEVKDFGIGERVLE